jgi:hypothetical protein
VLYGHVNQPRDPAIFAEDGQIYLLYAVAGESGIAIAKSGPSIQSYISDDSFRGLRVNC